MNRIRLAALLLALIMCVTLLPLPAFAQEYGEGLTVLRFTAALGDAALVTLVDGEGHPVLPMSEAGEYLLAPGDYHYFVLDPADGSMLVPVTPLTLDGSAERMEISLSEGAAPTVPETPPQIAESAPVEDESQAMPVIFQCDRVLDYTGLTITSGDGAVMQPYMDPVTGQMQFENYLLPPGEYTYWYSDPSGATPDQQGSFAVDGSGVQHVTLELSDGMAEGCFTATAVNPYYADLIPETFIPKPSISPEQSLAQLVAEVDGPRVSMNAVYQAGTDSAARSGSSSPIIYDSPETAGAALKRALIQRQTEVPIRVKTHIKPTKQIWWDMCWMIYDAAIKHTGAPTEGDYLRYEYGGVNCNGSATGSDEKREYYYEFVYAPLYFTTLEQEAELTNRVSAVLNSLSLSGKSDEQKIRAVYQYLCDNVKYEEARDTLGFTAYSALLNGKAACQGVSVAFYRLCLELGIDARVVTSKKMGHAWNIVRADGSNYYAADVTWDTGRRSEDWKYYLRGRTNWNTDHRLGDEFEDGRFAAYSFPDEDYGSATDAVIRSVSLLFDGLLRIKYYFVLPERLLAERGSSLVFSRGGETVLTVPLSEGRQEGEYTCFYCSVNAEDIDTPIQARIRRGSGEYVSISSTSGKTYLNGFFFSPMEYARQMKTAATTASMRALAQALEDYGVAAQNYFKNGSEKLRDEVLAVRASDLNAWNPEAEGDKPAGFKGVSLSVMFEADNSLRVYLQFERGSDPSRYSYMIDGQRAQLRQKSDGTVYLSVDNIAADALDTVHSFTVSNGTGRYTVKVSALSYARTAIERGSAAMANLGRALYLYNRAAEQYFG